MSTSTTNLSTIWSHKKRRRNVSSSSSSSYSSSSCSYFLSEKRTICLLLLIAWGWISVTIIMVFYHHHHHQSKSATATGSKQQQQPEEVSNVGPLVPNPGTSPLLIFTFSRSEYLRETLQDVYRSIPNDCSMGCPIVVSQDSYGTGGGGSVGQFREDVTAVIREFQDQFRQNKPNVPFWHFQHKHNTNTNNNNNNNLLRGGAPGGGGSGLGDSVAAAYAALAQHYAFALDRLFQLDANFQRVIILEEDLHISDDFFGYFQALAPLLDQDPTLLAISAYNDNGLRNKVHDPLRLLRSDFFPGLGWMMTRNLWIQELRQKWPWAYWDDWLREPAQRLGRHIIRPEISRTFHFGSRGGASNNQFGEQLQHIQLNSVFVDWKSQSLDYLLLNQYNSQYGKLVGDATLISSLPPPDLSVLQYNVRLEYANLPEFQVYAQALGIFDDEKAGVPRTAYHGIVEIRWGSHFLFLTPPLQQWTRDFGLQS